MDAGEELKTECIRAESAAQDRFDVLHEIARLAKRSPVLEAYSEDVVFEALDSRERIGSTAFGRFVAIPHCAFDEIESFVLGVVTVPRGVDFDSFDGEPTKVFFFIIGPGPARNRHIQILSTVSKVLENQEVVQRVIDAKTPEDIRALLAHRLPGASPEERPGRVSVMHVIVQRDKVFEQILELFASMNAGAITVIESSNASAYLHTVPLYSAFWNESNSRVGRIIVAYVDRALCNDLVRRINMIAGDIEREPGVMVAVYDPTYVSGSLDL